MVAPYFADGLKNGEGCLWVLPSTIEKLDAGWVSGTEQSKDFIDYEMKVNSDAIYTQAVA